MHTFYVKSERKTLPIMSTAPNLERQTSDSLNIPERRVVIKDPNELPPDYSTTPGGTIFSTTPGGGSIVHGLRHMHKNEVLIH